MSESTPATAYAAPAALTEANALAELELYLPHLPAYPGGYTGRGIVICGGGRRYFTCAWVAVNLLRRLGCALPIQLWHLGPEELDDTMQGLLAPLGVACVDALEARRRHPARILRGWELKPYALLHCPFQEALLLDADNVPVVNPEFLFETAPYQAAGAVFWPDFGRLPADHRIWHLTGVPYRDEPEFETGQILLDKARCWRALQLTKWINDYSDFFYRHVHGDKETFHFAWRKLAQPYAMPDRGIHALYGTMCQHDFDGRRIFQHRNLAKWTLAEANPRIVDFWLEAECLEYVAALRRQWPGRSAPRREPAGDAEAQALRELTTQTFLYVRVGYDLRPMRFQPDGLVGLGAAGCEVFWDVQAENGAVWLDIASEIGRTCRLTRERDGVWRGAWEVHERMPVELVPVPPRLLGARAAV